MISAQFQPLGWKGLHFVMVGKVILASLAFLSCAILESVNVDGRADMAYCSISHLCLLELVNVDGRAYSSPPIATSGTQPWNKYVKKTFKGMTVPINFYQCSPEWLWTFWFQHKNAETHKYIYRNWKDLNECERHSDNTEAKIWDSQVGDEHIPA